MNKKLQVLYGSNGVFIIAGALLGPLYAVFVNDFTSSALVISMSWAVMLITGFITFFMVHKLTSDDVQLNVNLITSGYIIAGLCWLLYLLANSLVFIFVIQAILGVGLSIGSASWLLLIAKNVDKGRGVKDFAEWSMLSRIVEILAVTTGGIIVTTFDFKALFAVMAVIAFSSAIILTSLRSRL